MIKLFKRSNRPMKFKDAKGELEEVLDKEHNLKIEEKPLNVQEKLIDNEPHEHEDHYHGIHHFDKYGHHDDIKPSEFTIKTQFTKSKKALTFRVAMAGLILGLSIVMSLVDMVYNKFTLYPDGVPMDIRILDLLVIVCGMPIVGLWGSIGICWIEPWIHMAIDPDHTAPQIALDCVCYSIAVIMFFFIYYVAFKNSPIHKEPDRRKRLFKALMPSVVLIPSLAVVFTASWILALYIQIATTGGNSDWSDFAKHDYGWFFAELGAQVFRFIVMYIFFALLEPTMKPINHRYR